MIVPLTLGKVVRPSGLIMDSHCAARNTPFVTNSKRLIITPATSPPRKTRDQLIFLIASSLRKICLQDSKVTLGRFGLSGGWFSLEADLKLT